MAGELLSPSFSPNLDASDFHLFPSLLNHFSGLGFTRKEEIKKSWVGIFFIRNPRILYIQEAIYNLIERSTEFIESNLECVYQYVY